VIGAFTRGAAVLTAAVLLMGAAAVPRQTGSLPRGGSYVVDPDTTVGSAAVSLWFRAPGAGYDDRTPGIANLAATAAAVAPLASGRSLYALVHSAGGDLNIEVYPDIVGIEAIVPAPATRRVVAAITAAYFAPAIDDTAVRTARANAAVLGVQQRYEADNALHDLLFRQVFAGGPAHYPPLPSTVSELTSISTAQIGDFAKRAFRSQNSMLVMTGNVDASSVEAVTDGSGGPGQADPPIDSPVASNPAPASVTGAVGGIGLAWVGPPITDQKAASALDFIADYLFREDTGTVTHALDRSASDATIAGQFITLHDPGVMIVTIGGDREEGARDRVLAAIAALQQPLDSRAFDGAREAFLYHVASDTQTPQERADNLGWYGAEGNLSYAPGLLNGSYVESVRSLDPTYVAGIVRRYLQAPVLVNLSAAAPQAPAQ
jgi:predicted Zn-dependent peptidase